MPRKIKKENPDVNVRLKILKYKKMAKIFIVFAIIVLGIIYVLIKAASGSNKKISEAKDVYELLPHVKEFKQYTHHLNPDSVWYSELKGYKKLKNIVILLNREDEYMIMNKDGVDYLVFIYVNSSHVGRVYKVLDIEKQYDGSTLKLSFKNDMVSAVDNPLECQGEANCIIKLEQSIDKLVVEGKEYKKYDGGVVWAGNKYGYVDGNLNIVAPAVYDKFKWQQTRRISNRNQEGKQDNLQEERVCMLTSEEGTCLIDKEKGMIFEAKYENIEVLDEDLYLVIEKKANSSEKTISIVNEDKKVICSREIGEGYLRDVYFEDGKYKFVYVNESVEMVDGKEKKVYSEELLDENLETIIEP